MSSHNAHPVTLDLDLSRGRFRALTFGDRTLPPLLWLHGFPDHPPTAESFLSLLARDHFVVAPWLRGYAPSTLAGPYDVETLAADALAIADAAFGPSTSFDLAGHDWGAVITYAVCAIAPTRVRRAVSLAVPHPWIVLRGFVDPRQWAASWYMALFQLPNAEALVRARDFALIDRLWRAWSPDFELERSRRRELHDCLAASLPAPLGYYRAIPRSSLALRRFARTLATPILHLHGADDGCILPPKSRDATIVPETGHFLHLEHPAQIAARVSAWLR